MRSDLEDFTNESFVLLSPIFLPRLINGYVNMMEKISPINSEKYEIEDEVFIAFILLISQIQKTEITQDYKEEILNE